MKNLKKEEKITIVGMTDFGFPYSRQARFVAYKEEPYTQYKKSCVVYYKIKNKRNITESRVYGDNKILVYRDWVNVNTEMFSNNSNLSKKCFDSQYLIDAENSVKDQKPIIING